MEIVCVCVYPEVIWGTCAGDSNSSPPAFSDSSLSPKSLLFTFLTVQLISLWLFSDIFQVSIAKEMRVS